MRPTRAFIVVGLATCAALVWAAESLNIRPGLWKTRSTLTLGGAPMYVDGMNETQRTQYAKSWAQMVSKPTTEDSDECITAKDIQEANLFKDLKEEGKSCKESNVRMTGTMMRATLDCKDAKTSTHTELDYTAASPTSFKGTIKSTITSPNGTTTMNIAMQGTFAAASCPEGDDD